MRFNATEYKFNNAANNEIVARFEQDGTCELYHNHSKKFETTSGGVEVFGELQMDDANSHIKIPDNARIDIGNGPDLKIYHEGTDSYLQNTTGTLRINNDGTDLVISTDDNIHIRTNGTEEAVKAIANGAVELYHDNSKKFETNSTGVHVTGMVTCTTEFRCDDNEKFVAGTGQDLTVFHNGSHSYIDHQGTGDLYLGTASASSGQNLRLMTNSTTRFSVISTGHFVPYANNTYDIGTSSYRVRNVYTNDLNLSNEGSSNDVDGTWGSYTIQEGAEDLFLVNKRNGKKYKFNLTEVS